jgi:hypothetical protein
VGLRVGRQQASRGKFIRDISSHTGFVGAVGQVLIHRPWLALRAADWNSGCGGVVQESVTARETLVELGQSPWGDNLDLWLQSIECQLEADLVVTLSSATVADSEATLLLGNGDLGPGDDWAGQRGAEEVDVLIDGIALNGREAELLDELPPQILNVAGNSTDLQCLRLGRFEVLYIVLMSVSRPFYRG